MGNNPQSGCYHLDHLSVEDPQLERITSSLLDQPIDHRGELRVLDSVTRTAWWHFQELGTPAIDALQRSPLSTSSILWG